MEVVTYNDFREQKKIAIILNESYLSGMTNIIIIRKYFVSFITTEITRRKNINYTYIHICMYININSKSGEHMINNLNSLYFEHFFVCIM